MKLLKVDTINEVKCKLAQYFGAPSEIQAEAECPLSGDNAAKDDSVCGGGTPGGVEQAPLFQASGRYLAEDIRSPEDVPGFTRSVVDGYAVAAKDTFGVSDSAPVFLDLAGSVDMGGRSEFSLLPGQAAYVPTGGMIPQGADAMVMVEYTDLLDENTVAVYKGAAPGNGLMNKSDDFKDGQLLYEKGHRITMKDIGMLAAIGKDTLEVYMQPVVSIISTGDEIVSIFEEPGPGQVRDVNSYTLAALIEKTGAKVGQIMLIRDSKEELQKAALAALDRSDIVLLSGGSSAGNKDMTADIIGAMGSPGVITHGIAMKPGKPTIIGVLKEERCQCCNRSKLAVGLPGHPMAAIIAYKVIVDYFIRKYYFHNEDEEITVTAEITENLHAGEGRETFVLVRLRKEMQDPGGNGQPGNEAGRGGGPENESGRWIAEPIHAKSGSISQLRYADGYVRIGDLSEGVAGGSLVSVTLLL